MPKLIYTDTADLPGEIWLPISGYEGFYEISNMGRVKRVAWSLRAKPGYIMTPDFYKNGYPRIDLRKPQERRRAFLLHRQVAIAFIPNPLGLPEVNHKDGILDNCKETNLEWCTTSDNIRHMWNIIKKHPRKRKFRLVSPDGEEFETDNLSQFTNDRGLPNAQFYRVLSGRYPTYRGWTCSYA